MLANALVIFARSPLAGGVKTRLAKAVGAATAAELYRAFLLDLGARLGRDPRWRASWSIATEPAVPFPAEIARGLPVRRQCGRDLGERMRQALGDALAEGSTAAAIIGSDVPHLGVERIAEAFDALAGADLVLVPAEDGGYALIAARSIPDVFAGIAWGGADVLTATLELARRAGLETRLLGSTYDVDRVEDLERLADEIAEGRIHGLDETEKVIHRAFRRRAPRL